MNNSWGLNKNTGCLFGWDDLFYTCDWMVRISDADAKKIMSGEKTFKEILRRKALLDEGYDMEEEPTTAPSVEAPPSTTDGVPYIPPMEDTEPNVYTKEMLESLSYDDLRETVKAVLGVDTLAKQSRESYIETVLAHNKE